MITVPPRLVVDTVAREGAAGRRWVEALPQLVARLCTRMGLRVDGPPMHGHCAVVVPVRHGHDPCVLKVSWIDGETVHEGTALRAWDGRGAVRLRAEEPHAGPLDGAAGPVWRVIHPTPLAGDPPFELLPLLRNRFAEADRPALLRRRLDLLAEAAGLDRQRAREWALARAVDDWLWSLTQETGDAEFTGIARCIAEWLAG
ncbi:MAG TPA: aminoglycoside phosphotransferase family protein [Pseudonocardiaceae bacterium]